MYVCIYVCMYVCDGMSRVDMIDEVNLHKSFEEKCTVCVLVYVYL